MMKANAEKTTAPAKISNSKRINELKGLRSTDADLNMLIYYL